MDKSLAIGFSNHFFREADRAIRGVIKKLSQKKVWKISRSSWSRFCNEAENQLGNMTLSVYEGGSKRKPYFAYMGLVIDEEKIYNNWQERCLTGRICINDYSSGACEMYPALFNISEHAIRRLIQRSLIDPADYQKDIFLVLDELKYVPLWSNYWFQMIFGYTNNFSKKDKLDYFQLIIPAPNGIFLAKISNDELPKVEIRTYVHDLQLSPDQMEMKNIMLKSTKSLANSPLSFLPLVEIMNVDASFGVTLLISYRLRECYKLLVNLLFEFVENDQLRALEKTEFGKFFIGNISSFSELLSNEFERVGVRAAQLEIQKGVIKAAHNE
jgi:hypothetical protein